MAQLWRWLMVFDFDLLEECLEQLGYDLGRFCAVAKSLLCGVYDVC